MYDPFWATIWYGVRQGFIFIVLYVDIQWSQHICRKDYSFPIKMSSHFVANPFTINVSLNFPFYSIAYMPILMATL